MMVGPCQSSRRYRDNQHKLLLATPSFLHLFPNSHTVFQCTNRRLYYAGSVTISEKRILRSMGVVQGETLTQNPAELHTSRAHRSFALDPGVRMGMELPAPRMALDSPPKELRSNSIISSSSETRASWNAGANPTFFLFESKTV